MIDMDRIAWHWWTGSACTDEAWDGGWCVLIIAKGRNKTRFLFQYGRIKVTAQPSRAVFDVTSFWMEHAFDLFEVTCSEYPAFESRCLCSTSSMRDALWRLATSSHRRLTSRSQATSSHRRPTPQPLLDDLAIHDMTQYTITGVHLYLTIHPTHSQPT
jgi:hypothetical protein